MICPLCGFSSLDLWSEDKFRNYYICHRCELVSVPRDKMLSSQQEKERYELHNNDENDPRYQAYLNTIVLAVTPFLTKTSRGLDFGCGRTELLSKLFSSQNIMADSFDLYFLPKDEIWERKYDFIVLSEVIEHLAAPLETMKKLGGLLNKDGQFFIKTKYYPAQEKFTEWFYKKDPTHVQFFSPSSMKYMTKDLGFEGPMELGNDLVRLWR